jgi:hypothetical protein
MLPDNSVLRLAAMRAVTRASSPASNKEYCEFFPRLLFGVTGQ